MTQRPLVCVAGVVVLLALLVVSGCGNRVSVDYPNRVVGADGQSFVLEDVETIAADPELTDDEKRERLRDLGLQDEKLITALLDL